MTSPDPRTAIVERREEIAAEPRPTRLADTDLAEEVAAVRETADIYRVYRPEWVVVHTAVWAAGDKDTADVVNRALEHFNEKYQGRVLSEHVQFAQAGTDNGLVVHLLLLLPNLKGEWKTKELAERYVKEQGWEDAKVVARNSKEDHEVRQYGVKKLPSTC